MAFLVLASFVFGFIPVIAEETIKSPDKNIFHLAYLFGISISAVIWGFRHPQWKDMHCVFLLILVPSIYYIVARGLLYLLLGVPVDMLQCMSAYIIGKGIYEELRFQRTHQNDKCLM